LINKEKMTAEPLLDLRAERLSVADFSYLTRLITANRD
jgi:16S rRNA (adenine1518-N6/adenine1519-N6)-dimethyltransferase